MKKTKGIKKGRFLVNSREKMESGKNMSIPWHLSFLLFQEIHTFRAFPKKKREK